MNKRKKEKKKKGRSVSGTGLLRTNSCFANYLNNVIVTAIITFT